jgi:hypothetical protein
LITTGVLRLVERGIGCVEEGVLRRAAARKRGGAGRERESRYAATAVEQIASL